MSGGLGFVAKGKAFCGSTARLFAAQQGDNRNILPNFATKSLFPVLGISFRQPVMRHIYNRILFVLLLLAVAMDVTARVHRHSGRRISVDTTSVLRAYTDSLVALRHRLDTSATTISTADMRFARLFMPFTFYHDVAERAFKVGCDTLAQGDHDNMTDRVMTHVYLTRPDLVADSEERLRKAGTIRNELDKPVRREVKLASHIEPVPDEGFVPVPSGVLIRKPNFWTFNGDSYLQFLQNYVTGNWYKGGESNYSMVSSLTFNANYNNKSRVKFENKLELRLGFQTSRDDTLHRFKTNNDLIRYTGKFGLQAHSQWYYSLQLLAYTQFTYGLKSNDKYVYSDFMSPFDLNIGLGMDYTVKTNNKRLTGSINLSFLSFNFRYVDRKNLASRYSIAGDHHTREDFGSQLTANLTWTPNENISWKTRLYGYTSYSRALVEWENTITLKVSRYISTNIFLYPRFDDSTKRDEKLGYLQFKEYCSLGFSYAF